MVKRAENDTTTHDEKVRRAAQKLKSQGWDVSADLLGYKKPKPVGKEGKIPDVEARKRGATQLIEVETPDTVEAHKDQQATFRRSAGHRARTTFKVVIAKNKR